MKQSRVDLRPETHSEHFTSPSVLVQKLMGWQKARTFATDVVMVPSHRLSSSPRSTDKRIIELVQLIDKAIAKNKDSKLTAFVNVLGEDKDDLSDAAKKLAKTTKAANVPFVVPNEFENGPDNYGISPKAEVTIILASGLGVKANFAVSDVNDLKTAAVLADLKKIL